MHVRLIAALLAVAILAACEKEAPPQQRPAPQVSVVTVKPQTMTKLQAMIVPMTRR